MAAAVASNGHDGSSNAAASTSQLPPLDGLLRKSVVRTRGLFSMADPLLLGDGGAGFNGAER